MKKLNFLFLGLLSFMPIWGCNDDDSLPEAVVEVKEGHNEDIVSVIDYDIKNDGTLIGSQLNNLVGQSYSFHIKKTSNLLVTNHFRKFGTIYITSNQITPGRKIQLAQLLVQCHLSHQIGNISIHLFISFFSRQ
jgi:hypothetical protein